MIMGEQLTKQAQDIGLEILRETISLCKRNNIPYYLVEGTLLGAVRHKGFIPWDDDIDIAIPITKIKDFARHAAEEFPSNIYVDAAFSQDRKFKIMPDATRVYNSEYIMIDQSQLKFDAYIDVLAIIGMPANRLLRMIHYWMLVIRKGMTRISKPEIIGSGHWSNTRGIRKVVIALAKRINFSKIFPYEKQIKKLEKCILKYPVNDCKYVMAYPSCYGKKEIVPLSYYGDGVDGQFEDLEVTLPSEYHMLLTALYDDYMVLPPEDKRQGTHFIEILRK